MINIVKDRGGGEEGYQCEDCPTKCQTLRRLQQHKSLVHKDKTFICSDCGVEVKGPRNFNNHRRKHKDKVACPHCPKQFNRGALAKHVASSREGYDWQSPEKTPSQGLS